MRLTGAKPSTTKHRVNGSRDVAPKWWRSVRKARGLGDMRRLLAEQQRRIAQLELSLD